MPPRCGHDPLRLPPPGEPYTWKTCALCWAYATHPGYNRRWGGPGVPRTPLPCIHLGTDTGRRERCLPCEEKGKGQVLKVLACAVHGRCTVERQVDGLACCAGCKEHAPDTFSLVAPLGSAGRPGSWMGRAKRKPWQYRVTALIPHLDTLDLLETCLGLLRLQDEPPYLVVIDTGSPPAVRATLETWRAEDLEIHYVLGNAYTNSSEPVAVALDLGMARVNTPLILLTHTDCFLRRRDAISWLAQQCSEECPAVGWEMSDRSWITDQWRGMVSHTFTMLHAPTMRRIGATWHFQRARDLLGMGTNYAGMGWPDTETGLNLILRQAGITPQLLGPEHNCSRNVTEWYDHARSYFGLRTYSAGSHLYQRAVAYTRAALKDAQARLLRWQRGED